MADVDVTKEFISILAVKKTPQEVVMEVDPDGTNVLVKSENGEMKIAQILDPPSIIVDPHTETIIQPIIESITVNVMEGGPGGGSGGSEYIGIPTDGTYDDGLNPWTPNTRIPDAFDDVNEILAALAPADCGGLAGMNMTLGATLYRGRLSQENINYKPGQGAGALAIYIIIGGGFNAWTSSPSTKFNKADSGALKARFNGILGGDFDLAGNFLETERPGPQSYCPKTSTDGTITVTSVSMYNNFPKWQKGNATVNALTSLVRQGYNTVSLLHDGLSAPQETNSIEVFHDIGTVFPSITIPTVSEKAPVYKHLSGVKFYGRGATFNLGCIASHVFDNTYHEYGPVIYSSSDGTMGIGIIDFDDSAVTGPSNPPRPAEGMTVTDYVMTVPNSNVRNMDAVANVQARKPWGQSNILYSPSVNRMIDAYAITSDETHEYFDDENRRLPGGAYDTIPATLTGQWNSLVFLTTGNAQVYNGILIFPQSNFQLRLPNVSQPDYTGFSGDQKYFRSFYRLFPHSSGILRIMGITGADLSPVGSGNVNLEIKLPSQTGWLDLGKPFDSGVFTGIDGDGCRVSQTGNTWAWTCGTFTTANSGWMIIVRLTIRNKNIVVQELSEVNW